MPCRTIAVANQKGGTGKTATTLSLGIAPQGGRLRHPLGAHARAARQRGGRTLPGERERTQRRPRESATSRFRPLQASQGCSPTKETVNAAVQSSERLEGAASLLRMLEDKADSEQITASELSAVRCIVEACASDLDAVLERA